MNNPKTNILGGITMIKKMTMTMKLLAVTLCVTFMMAAVSVHASEYLPDGYGGYIIVDGVDLGFRTRFPNPGDLGYEEFAELQMMTTADYFGGTENVAPFSSSGTRSYHSPRFTSSVVIGGAANPAVFTLTGAGVGVLRVVSPFQATADGGWWSVDLAYQLRNMDGAIVDSIVRIGGGFVLGFEFCLFAAVVFA
jgi:hypothetical protein